jgi:hypothetical protein
MSWGQRLLMLRMAGQAAGNQDTHLLQARAGHGLGVRGFLSPEPPPQKNDTSADILELKGLADAQQRLGRGSQPDDIFLPSAGRSRGGARPNARVQDEVGYWIAKCPSSRDDVDMMGLEAASLERPR